MSSRKPSAKAKRALDFKKQLAPDMSDDLFDKEKASLEARAVQRNEARKSKGCTSKKRYRTRGEAEAAIFACAEHGTTGLHCYKCSYCNGWHLTSRQPDR